MARGKARKWTQEEAAKAIAFLDSLPQKPADKIRMNLATFVSTIAPKLAELIAHGYTVAEVAEMLRGQGMPIADGTIRTYLAQSQRARKDNVQPTARRPSKKASAAAAEIVLPPKAHASVAGVDLSAIAKTASPLAAAQHVSQSEVPRRTSTPSPADSPDSI